jgi:hypothetical protein
MMHATTPQALEHIYKYGFMCIMMNKRLNEHCAPKGASKNAHLSLNSLMRQ